MLNQSIFRPRFLLVGLAVTLLAGCATNRQVAHLEKTAVPVVNSRFDAAAYPRTSDSTFTVSNGFYAARKPIQVSPVNPPVRLPESFYKNTSMNVQTRTTLTEIAARVARLSGYQVSIDQDVLSGGDSSRGASSPAPASQPPAVNDPSAPPSSLPPLPGGNPSFGGAPSFEPTPSGASEDLSLNKLVFDGNLSGLLDNVTGLLNLSWRWTGNRVEIFRYETKMFRLNALAGSANVSTNLNTTSSSLSSSGGGGAGGSSGSGGTQGSSGSQTSVSSQMEIWDEVEASIESVLSEGGEMSSTPSAGIITVRDTPQVLRQVEAQISEFNRIYSRQVMLNVEVYAVERSSSDAAAIDWNMVWNSASSRYGFGLNTGGGASGSSNAFKLDVNRGPFTGSSIVASVLSTVGNSTLLTSAPVTTLNGQTVPLNISRDQAYVAEYSTTQNGSGGVAQSTTTITPGVVSEGFSMNVTPRILEDNNVLIRYAVDLSTIEGIQEFTSPDGLSAIQLPRRAVRNFLQNVNVKSGQTLVLTGFQQITGTRDDSGPGSPKAWFLGGQKSSIMKSRTLVIVITPYVMQ